MRRATCLVVLSLWSVACSGGSADTELVVSAAASLTDAFGDLEVAFEQEHPGTDVVLNLGGSSALREQILEGAPIGVFASANVETMAAVVEEGLASAPEVFALNRLVLAVPSGNPAGVSSLADLGRSDLLVGLCIAAVPCGALAVDALERAGIEAAADSEEPDVRSLLAKLEADELDVALVYASDAAASDEVDVVAEVDVETAYLIALIDTRRDAAAEAFVAFVRSDRGRQVLAEYGFLLP